MTRLHWTLCLAYWLSEWHSLIEKSLGPRHEIASLEWHMYKITVYSGFLALMSTSLIIPNFSALQIPSDNNMLQASITLKQCNRRAFHYTVNSRNPSTSLALTEHQTHDSETEQTRRMKQLGTRRRWRGAA